MSTNATRPEKDTDQLTRTEEQALQSRAIDDIGGRHILGVDGERSIHVYSSANNLVAVYETVGDTDPAVYKLDARPIDWAADVAEERGKWLDLRLSYAASRVLEVDR